MHALNDLLKNIEMIVDSLAWRHRLIDRSRWITPHLPATHSGGTNYNISDPLAAMRKCQETIACNAWIYNPLTNESWNSKYDDAITTAGAPPMTLKTTAFNTSDVRVLGTICYDPYWAYWCIYPGKDQSSGWNSIGALLLLI